VSPTPVGVGLTELLNVQGSLEELERGQDADDDPRVGEEHQAPDERVLEVPDQQTLEPVLAHGLGGVVAGDRDDLEAHVLLDGPALLDVGEVADVLVLGHVHLVADVTLDADDRLLVGLLHGNSSGKDGCTFLLHTE